MHITLPELVKKLAVAPERRTKNDCKEIAGALFFYITSIAEFKGGLHFLLLSPFSIAKLPLYVLPSSSIPINLKFAQTLRYQMLRQWPSALS